MPRLKITGVTLLLGEHEVILKEKIASLLNIPCEDILTWEVVRKSIDARRKKPPCFIYSVAVSVPYSVDPAGKEGVDMEILPEEKDLPHTPATIKPVKRPAIVGCGPAGLFAALFLAERGIPVILLERGRKVTERLTDVQSFWETGILNTESHVHFGEGGAGTFSDGKLTSRAKSPFTGWVKKALVDAGAPSEILSDGKPHIGTDRLRDVVVNLREKLIKCGSEVRFESRVTDLIIHQGSIEGVVVKNEELIKANHVILASGQSATDTYGMLYDHGVRLEPKPFAMGLRVEHPQDLIDRIQYGKWCGHPQMPPADYFLTAKLPDMNRSVYTFCMCPGGYIIGCSAEEGGIITNGMSLYKRDSPYANSAVVVNVRVEDFKEDTSHPLSGLIFRRHWEEKAFMRAGENYCAPAQGLVDFLRDGEGAILNVTSFSPGVRPVRLRDVLPSYVADALKRGIGEFDRKMRGFITEEATLIGVETRTSSPVRIVRGPDGQSVSVTGLYPCGEGAGYAGGIVSSALDGIRVAMAIMSGK